jgi:ParB-like chromosome segregation protein Spo0J
MTKKSGEKSGEMKKDLRGEVRLVPVKDVVVPEKRMRDLGDITPIVNSIKDVGLIEPIIIRRETGELISGLHRLKSISALGHPQILARLVDVSDVQAAMMEVDENLARVELTALERAEHMARRKQLYETLHPKVKHGGAPGKAGGGTAKSKDARVASFAADTAQKTGLSQRTVQEDVQIAAKLSPEAKRAVKGTLLAGKKRELLALSRLPSQEQATVARAVASGEVTTVAEAAQKPGDERNTLIESNLKSVGADLVPRPSERVAVNRMLTMPPKRCWRCGAPREKPLGVQGVLGTLPSGEVVQVSYEAENRRQIEIVGRAMSGVLPAARALGALPPGEERSKLAQAVADLGAKGIQTLGGLLSPTLKPAG